jgi:hypothetical protein
MNPTPRPAKTAEFGDAEEIIKVVDAASARFKGILAGFAISRASAQPPSPDANNYRVARN